MKVAIATDNGTVSQHFGHCEGFAIYDIENGLVKEEKFAPNPGHRPGFLPIFLNELGMNAIIAGGMGDGAVQIFNGHGIEVLTGIDGRNDEVVRQYLQGSLVSSGSVCHEHNHADSCNGH
ncbi:MAG: NifB/NifX family molybdenum-iron cluster-binding protein [Firmicutes bacterium]|nr:NifB/NifX family molybdenum-iron cluster-binding protein [Bacillota bacterium]